MVSCISYNGTLPWLMLLVMCYSVMITYVECKTIKRDFYAPLPCWIRVCLTPGMWRQSLWRCRVASSRETCRHSPDKQINAKYVNAFLVVAFQIPGSVWARHLFPATEAVGEVDFGGQFAGVCSLRVSWPLPCAWSSDSFSSVQYWSITCVHRLHPWWTYLKKWG